MKKLSLIVGMALQAVVWSVSAAEGSEMHLTEARQLIGKIITEDQKSTMADVMGKLSAADQTAFLSEVNKAVAGLPASTEEKSAKFLNLNRAAVKSAQKGNAPAVLAEAFATVPPESLTVLNERFALDLMNRTSGSNNKYTDEEYTRLCTNLMTIVNRRMEETDNASPRSAFVILMLVRASNGAPVDLADKLIDTLPNEDAKELARTEWIPAALGKDGREQSYEPLLASADAGRRPDFDQVLVIAGPQFGDAILHDLVGKNTDEKSFMRTRSPVLDAVINPLNDAYGPVMSDGPEVVMPQVDFNKPKEPAAKVEQKSCCCCCYPGCNF